MKTRFTLWVAKDGKKVSSQEFDNKQQLEKAYTDAKDKFGATEEENHGFYKFATGRSDDGKEINLRYSENDTLPSPGMKM